MDRKHFIKGFGIAGTATLLPFRKNIFEAVAKPGGAQSPTACTLIPAETRGPYPLPATVNASTVARADIRETKTGILLTLTITVQNLNCSPISNARVDIWHCDKDGYYSGYNNQPGYLGTQNNAGTTFLRGNLTTDANGQVVFTTIYPGWYTGRVTHIHAEVYIGGVLQRTSQFAFPDSLNTAVYTTAALYTAHGTNSIVNASDNVFSDGSSTQLLTIAGNINAGYAANHTFTINYTIIPLKLLSFNGGIANNAAILWWSTENELNTSRFEIERSLDGTVFTKIGISTAKRSAAINNYTYSDNNAGFQQAFYRLKMVDTDGNFSYSNIIRLTMKNTSTLVINPNPVKNSFTLSHPTAGSNCSIEILSIDGRSVATGNIVPGASVTNMDAGILSKGIYLLIFKNNGSKQVIKFVKN